MGGNLRESPYQRGQWAEQMAVEYLRACGLSELKRNYRCPCGEIDLIMRHHMTIVFIEVRYRAHHRYGYATETIDLRKQGRVLKTAYHYLQTHHWADRLPCRFDVVVVGGDRRKPEFEWIRGAFQA